MGGAVLNTACDWYANLAFSVNVNITDGQTHQVALYLWDVDGFGGGRNETIQVLDSADNVLDSETASSFGGVSTWSGP